MKSTISERLKTIMRQNKLKQVDIIEKSKKFEAETGVKISKTDLSQYVNGKVEPGQEKLYVLAKTLDVSEAWLDGYDVPQHRPSDEERQEHARNSKFDTIAAHIDDDVTDEELEEIRNYIDFIKSKRN